MLQVLAFTLLLFINVGDGCRKAAWKCKTLLRNFVWARGKHHARAIIKWGDWCMQIFLGELGLINLQEALVVLLSKWVLKALKPRDSNFKIWLWFKLKKCKPSKHVMWILDLNWALVHIHVSPLDSKICVKAMKAWKLMGVELPLVWHNL
jgi:hypothetical protein